MNRSFGQHGLHVRHKDAILFWVIVFITVQTPGAATYTIAPLPRGEGDGGVSMAVSGGATPLSLQLFAEGRG